MAQNNKTYNEINILASLLNTCFNLLYYSCDEQFIIIIYYNKPIKIIDNYIIVCYINYVNLDLSIYF